MSKTNFIFYFSLLFFTISCNSNISITVVKSAEVIPVIDSNVSINFIYNDEKSYKENTKLLEKLLNATNDTLILSNPKGKSVLYIDRIKINKDIFINGNGLTLKRAPIVASLYPIKKLKSFRLIDLAGTQANKVEILNLNLDGSIFEMNERYNLQYKKYQVEHSALLFVSKKNNANQSRVHITVKNCHFKNSGGDGIHVYRNVDATIIDNQATDCFRGGVTLTGGNSKLLVDGFKTIKKKLRTGIDVEIDGEDFYGNKSVSVILKNLLLDSDLDIGVGANSSIYGENITQLKPPFFMSFKKSKAYFKDCNFVNNTIVNKKSRIRAYGDLTFENCTFTALSNEEGFTSASPPVLDAGFKDQKILFKNCKFKAEEGIINDKSKIIGVPFEVSSLKSKNLRSFENCTFDSSLGIGIQSFQGNCIDSKLSAGRGGKINIEDSDFSCEIPMRFNGLDSHPFYINLKNIHLNSKEFIVLKTIGSKVYDTLFLQDIRIKQKSNKITFLGSKIIEDKIYVNGSRIIEGNNNPNEISANGFKNDKYIFNDTVWNCVESGYYYSVNDISKYDDCTPVEAIKKIKNKKATWELTNLTPEELN